MTLKVEAWVLALGLTLTALLLVVRWFLQKSLVVRFREEEENGGEKDERKVGFRP